MEGFLGFTAIFGIFIFPLLFVILIVWIVSRNNRKKAEFEAQMMRDIYLRASESGKEIPELKFQPRIKKDKSLKTGIILLAVGIGLSLMVMLSSADNMNKLHGASVGILPACIGLGFLCVHFLQKKKVTSNDEE